jgi:hypothetical protein
MAIQQPQIDPAQMNLMARQMLLTTGIKMIKRLQPVKATAMGQQMQIPLQRMGIMTGITLNFTVDIGDVTDPVASAYFPHNFAQQIQYTDFAGVNRTKTSGWQLWAAQGFKHNEILGGTAYQTQASDATGFGFRNTNILSRPDVATVDNGKVYFSLYIPLAYDAANDLTGAVLTQTNVGEHFVTITLANALVGADSWACPFISGTVPLGAGGITVEAFQHYIQPQSLNAAQLPLIDLSTVYGFEGAYQTTANIAAGQSTYINYPNNRSILSSLITFENGDAGTANETDVSQVTLLANSNTNFWEMTPRFQREMMRQIADGDLPSGNYYFPHRRQPILTQLYANVQAKYDVASVAGSGVIQFVSQFEVQYPSGSPLPGITA